MHRSTKSTMKKLADRSISSSSLEESESDSKKAKARASCSKKTRGRKKKKVKAISDSSSESGAEEKKIVVKKGSAAVDQEFPEASSYHVYESEDKVYNASMMLSDMRKNNNKFYIVQLLESDGGATNYVLWTRWGRVGFTGQSRLIKYSNSDQGMREYEKKYSAKKKTGYKDVEITYDEDTKEDIKEEAKETADATKKKESKLDKRVQDLIKLIFNMNMMKRQMIEIGYDAKKLPLGKLSKETIKKGYEILEKIANELNYFADKEILLDLSSEFFTTIPHDFGFK
eukprot:TRINITY_DN6010_c0_g1_i3.p1 TRINITY_DN6010_c0_g1~~TRINITY_DN6010_c0_g1_i3.p1  ORF type:complete len:285 (+),score=84.49 TRINITY_DN6010_c0_g1_i3:2372-3226(+)